MYFGTKRMSISILITALTIWLCTACSISHPAAQESMAVHAFMSGPRVIVSAALLAPSQEEACRHLARTEVTDDGRGAFDAGMLKADYEGFRTAVKSVRATVTFRDSNHACLQHLAAGVQSKPHAVLQKTWEESNLQAEDKSMAGLVSDLMAKPPKGEKISNPHLTLYRGEPVTCDYDMVDMMEPDGKRIEGESTRDRAIRAALNASAAVTPSGHRDRIMHGAQAGYGAYMKAHPEETIVRTIFKPESPLTVFAHDGKVYRLSTIEDDLNYYKCIGAQLPIEWDVEVEDFSTNPHGLKRLQ